MFAYCGNSPIERADVTGKIFIIIIPSGTSDDDENKKYTEDNVNIYMEGEGSRVEGKLNVCFYDNRDGFININIENSLQITDNVEQREVLKLITKSKYYNEETYGDINFMQAQWIVHNKAHSLAKSGDIGSSIVKWFSGADDPVMSSEVLDLRPKKNMGSVARLIYKIVSSGCHGTPKYPTSFRNDALI